jgi:MSHA biogenesis protein MshJ
MNTTVLMDDLELAKRPTLAASFAPILAPWHALQRQFNARLTRERVLMIGVALTLALAASDHWLIGPAFTAYRQAAKQQEAVMQQQTELQTQALQLGRRTNTQQKLKTAELKAWRERVRDGEAVLQSHEDTLVGPGQMMGLLEQLLGRHNEVRVLSMKQLDRIDLLADPATAAALKTAQGLSAGTRASQSGQPGTPKEPAASLYRHGVELELAGSFASLLAYVQALEALPQHLLWGPMSLSVEQYPTARLSLRLYTISRDRHWLEF